MGTKYEMLELHLRNQPHPAMSVSMSFKDIESILGSKLPNSAFTYREWWSNQKDTSNRPQAKAWIAAGFKVGRVNQKRESGSVEFIRT